MKTRTSIRRPHIVVALAIATVLTAASAVTLGSARAASDLYIAFAPIEGEYSYSSICELGACANVYRYTGSGPCLQSCGGFPTSADVTIDVSGATTKAFPPSPCISKSISGTFSISWSDATISTGTLAGRSHDGKAYSFSGTIRTGAYAGGSITAVVGFPPNPCLSGSFSGGFTLIPPAA